MSRLGRVERSSKGRRPRRSASNTHVFKYQLSGDPRRAEESELKRALQQSIEDQIKSDIKKLNVVNNHKKKCDDTSSINKTCSNTTKITINNNNNNTNDNTVTTTNNNNINGNTNNTISNGNIFIQNNTDSSSHKLQPYAKQQPKLQQNPQTQHLRSPQLHLRSQSLQQQHGRLQRNKQHRQLRLKHQLLHLHKQQHLHQNNHNHNHHQLQQQQQQQSQPQPQLQLQPQPQPQPQIHRQQQQLQQSQNNKNGNHSKSAISACKQKPSSWSLIGQPEEKFIITRDDEPLRKVICYSAIKHTDGDIINVKDSVLVKSGSKKNDVPFIAKIRALWKDLDSEHVMMSILWYYRPEHMEDPSKTGILMDEVYASRHRDIESAECIEDKCYVLTFNEYCRYRKRNRMEEFDVTLSLTDRVIPNLQESYSRMHRIPDSSVSPELVFVCRQIYDSRYKKLIKNPLINSKYGNF